MSFAELGLSDKVLKAAEAAGYTSPTPIQKQAIPHVLARRDVLGIAQTGTGKTAAFTLPMLTLLESGRARARMPRTLILEPTRELAAQVEENFIKYGSQHKLSVALLIGGVSFGDQDAKITRGVDVLIATPGRLLDHFERGKLLLTGVELFVIDEADRMLDMGFIPDIERIAKLVPFTRQTLFFSATMPPEIQKLADAFLHNPVKVEATRPASTATTITQRLVSTGREPHQKRATLRDLIRGAEDLKNAIIFCNRKRDIATLHRSLVRHGFSAVALHGDMDQRARMQALDSFRNGEISLLVASDVAARGLDIPDVSHVFNYDVPFHAEDYVHRIGRTGRAGRSGTAYSLAARGDEKSVQDIESLIGQAIEWRGKTLAERTEEDDEYSAPDRGQGWRHDDNDRRGNRRHRGGRGGRDQHQRTERGGGEREHHGERRGDRSEQRSGDNNPRRQDHPRTEGQNPQWRDNRRDENRREDNRRDDNRRDDNRRDQHRRRDRYDNEPDIPVVGFGDHVPAFLARPLPSLGKTEEVSGSTTERRPVTPTSFTPRNVVEKEEIKAEKAEPKTRNKAKAKPAKEEIPETQAAPIQSDLEEKPKRKAVRKGKTADAEPAIVPDEEKSQDKKAKASRSAKPKTSKAAEPVAAISEEAKPTKIKTSKKKADSAEDEPPKAKKATGGRKNAAKEKTETAKKTTTRKVKSEEKTSTKKATAKKASA